MPTENEECLIYGIAHCHTNYGTCMGKDTSPCASQAVQQEAAGPTPRTRGLQPRQAPSLCAPGARGKPRVSEHGEAMSHRHVVTPQTKIACLRLRWVIFTRGQRWVPAVAWCRCPAHGGSLPSPQPHPHTHPNAPCPERAVPECTGSGRTHPQGQSHWHTLQALTARL